MLRCEKFEDQGFRAAWQGARFTVGGSWAIGLSRIENNKPTISLYGACISGPLFCASPNASLPHAVRLQKTTTIGKQLAEKMAQSSFALAV